MSILEDDSENDSIADGNIEVASDDEEVTQRTRRKRKIDEEYKEEEKSQSSSDSDLRLDEFENESLS